MGVKRKRSSSELCSSPVSSTFSSPPSNGTFTMEVTPCIFNPRPNAPAHLHSRTLKRFRDSRPSETIIHERTLNLLYTAQQQQGHASPPQSIETVMEIEAPQSTTNQQSLHRFWNINSRPTPVAPATTIQRPNTPQSCEDCGAGIASSTCVDSMKLDDCTAQNAVCLACGKHVCFSCSVSNLGEQRHCLRCARGAW